MKPFALASFALNLILIALVVLTGTRAPAKLRETDPAAVLPLGQKPIEGRQAAMPQSTQIITNHVTQKLDWRSLESDDYEIYIANLRAIGCPEETIRDIVKADVKALFNNKLKEALPPAQPYQYWKGGNPFASAMNPDRIAKVRELQDQRRSMLGRLIGTNGNVEDSSALANPLAEVLPFLKPEQHQAIERVRQDFKASALQTQGLLMTVGAL